MDSRWNDADARKAVETYAKKGVSEALALRTYTTRLLGGDPMLVLHGGGNTSREDARWPTCWARRTRCCASRARAGTWPSSSRQVCRP